MTLPLTYPDLVCDLDLDPYASETASDLQNLIQDCTHVLMQELGSNPDDPLRGVGIGNYLNGTAESFRSLPGIIEEQLGRDSRVDAVAATIGGGTTDFNFVVSIQIQVSGSVLDLQFGYSNVNGLINITPG